MVLRLSSNIIGDDKTNFPHILLLTDRQVKNLRQAFANNLSIHDAFLLLEGVSMNNQEWKVRPEIVNVNSNETVFYPFIIKANKCSGSCNDINDTYANCVFLMFLKTYISKNLL